PAWLMERLTGAKTRPGRQQIHRAPSLTPGSFSLALQLLHGDAPIRERERNQALTRIGGRLRYEGHEESEIAARLLEINAPRCHPPLSPFEVKKIARSASRYPKGQGRAQATTAAVHDFLAALLASPSPYVWRGKTGASRHEVLLAAGAVAEEWGSLI